VYGILARNRSTVYMAGIRPSGEFLSTSDKHRFVAGIAREYGGRLKRFLRSKTGNTADVPDLAEEAFLRLLRISNHEEIRSPEAYLFMIASHVIQQHHTKQVATPFECYSPGDGPTRAVYSFQAWSTAGLNRAISILEARVHSST